MNHDSLEHDSPTDQNKASPHVRGSLPTWGTWERMVPKQIAKDPGSQKLLKSHLRRYETAATYSIGKHVLDIACGTGYGSQILHTKGATSVIGVDKFPEIVNYAKRNYHEDHVEFICADAENFEWSTPFDIVVSFETLEHLPHPEKFLTRIRSLIKPTGTFLLSVPLGETRHLDAYHLHAFSQADVFELLETTKFKVENYYTDVLNLTGLDLLLWRKYYPDSQPTIYDLLFTGRGRHLIKDIILHRGLRVPELLVVARPNP